MQKLELTKREILKSLQEVIKKHPSMRAIVDALEEYPDNTPFEIIVDDNGGITINPQELN